MSIRLDGWFQTSNIHKASDLELMAHFLECEKQAKEATQQVEQLTEVCYHDNCIDNVMKWSQAVEAEEIFTKRLGVARCEMISRTLTAAKV